VYAGDLYGNFWRFDISDPDVGKWNVTKLAKLTDSGGQPQPVTTPPQIEIDIQNGVDRWVFVGTGKLYHQTDLGDTQTQTMYAFRDGTAALPKNYGKTLTKADLDLVKDKDGLASKPANGWYDDLAAGERIVVPPQATLSTVVYSATLPQTDPCLTGQPANVYAREFSHGNSLITDDSGATVEFVLSAAG
jgi:type IV pilus assembly protein PilY1